MILRAAIVVSCVPRLLKSEDTRANFGCGAARRDGGSDARNAAAAANGAGGRGRARDAPRSGRPGDRLDVGRRSDPWRYGSRGAVPAYVDRSRRQTAASVRTRVLPA